MFDKNDKVMMTGLKKILDEATFPLKKREVPAFVTVNNWVVDLEKRINKYLKEQEECQD